MLGIRDVCHASFSVLQLTGDSVSCCIMNDLKTVPRVSLYLSRTLCLRVIFLQISFHVLAMKYDHDLNVSGCAVVLNINL